MRFDPPELVRIHRDLVLVAAVLCLVFLVAGVVAGLRDETGWAFYVAGGAITPFVALVLIAALMARMGERPRFLALLRAGYPLAFWPLLYTGAVEIVQLFPERYFDEGVAHLDAILLGYDGPVPAWQLGGPVEELASLLYLSYYVVVPLGFFWAWFRRGPVAATGYSLAVLVAFTVCGLVWVLLPTGGHYLDGAPDDPPWGPFTAIARSIYAANPHYAAALPSSHVAISVVTAAMVGRLGGSGWLWFWTAGVAWATIYGQYHYMLDTPTGALAGLIGVWAYVAATRAPAPSEQPADARPRP